MRKGQGMSDVTLREYTALLQRADAERERLQSMMNPHREAV
jgi:hypothetical protein